jgi:hypothetical protein
MGYTEDPAALYDKANHRFWIEILQYVTRYQQKALQETERKIIRKEIINLLVTESE